jgi:hypothetical protein
LVGAPDQGARSNGPETESLAVGRPLGSIQQPWQPKTLISLLPPALIQHPARWRREPHRPDLCHHLIVAVLYRRHWVSPRPRQAALGVVPLRPGQRAKGPPPCTTGLGVNLSNTQRSYVTHNWKYDFFGFSVFTPRLRSGQVLAWADPSPLPRSNGASNYWKLGSPSAQEQQAPSLQPRNRGRPTALPPAGASVGTGIRKPNLLGCIVLYYFSSLLLGLLDLGDPLPASVRYQFQFFQEAGRKIVCSTDVCFAKLVEW